MVTLKAAFRVDASLEIGTGHVMRCLTLATALSATGAKCHFICREHTGNLIDIIRAKGFTVHILPALEPEQDGRHLTAPDSEPALLHQQWLGTTQAVDAGSCLPIVADIQPDWLIVDHYALDARWELALRPHYRKLLVMDDLADRRHTCDVLLDQTYGRSEDDYRPLVPDDCTLLCGSQYALLRPEFAALRPYSLARRAKPELRHLLITMGGADKDNATGLVLEALRECRLPADCKITVVMGATSPWLGQVAAQALEMPVATTVKVGVTNMAQLMADSDLAIGAAGTTSWERCCLGLPTILIVSAENQIGVANGLANEGAANVIELGHSIPDRLPKLIEPLIEQASILQTMTQAAAPLVDGKGSEAVIELLGD